DEIRIWSRTPEHAAALAESGGATAVGSIEEALAGGAPGGSATQGRGPAGPDGRCTPTRPRDPSARREWLAPGAHVNAVGSSIPTTRELDTATVAAASLFVDRRESTLNEAGDFLFPQREGAIGPDHIRAELGEILTGTAPGRTSPDELTVFKSL